METNEKILKKIYLFSRFDDKEISKIAQLAKTLSVHQGDTVFREGNDAKSFYVVKHGTLKISTSAQSGDDVNLTTISSGDHFGELPFFDRQKRAATVEAMELTELLEIPYDELETVLSKSEAMQIHFYKSISFNLIQRLRALTQDLTYAREIKKRFT
jgi:CRP/FNR family cyclic AMP-dependent transcriptional regulator